MAVNDKSLQNLQPFQGNQEDGKKDPRINRGGRPKSFDALRKLMQKKAGEIATDAEGKPILDRDGKPMTNAEMFVEAWMKDRKQRKAFAEFAWGKPKEEIDLTSGGEKIKGYIGFTPEQWDKKDDGNS
jgi:hypothetical protein